MAIRRYESALLHTLLMGFTWLHLADTSAVTLPRNVGRSRCNVQLFGPSCTIDAGHMLGLAVAAEVQPCCPAVPSNSAPNHL